MFNKNTIVVFNGVIGTFESLRHFIDDLDDVRLATEDELKIYNNR